MNYRARKYFYFVQSKVKFLLSVRLVIMLAENDKCTVNKDHLTWGLFVYERLAKPGSGLGRG